MKQTARSQVELLALSKVESGVSCEKLNLILFAELDELGVVCRCELDHLCGGRVDSRVLDDSGRALTVRPSAPLLQRARIPVIAFVSLLG